MEAQIKRNGNIITGKLAALFMKIGIAEELPEGIKYVPKKKPGRKPKAK